MKDLVLERMADELRSTLIAMGYDPQNPPGNSQPPAGKAFAEYQRRGGLVYTSPAIFINALIVEVGKDQA